MMTCAEARRALAEETMQSGDADVVDGTRHCP
jgi:hypothetical protein